MQPDLLTITVFSLQLLVMIGVASVAETLGRVTDPRFRLTYWRGVALACLALPWCAVVRPASFGSGVTLLVASADVGSSAAVRGVVPAAGAVVWWLLCAGALARLGWLTAGALRLRRLRQRSRAAVVTPDLETLRSAVAPQAELRVCDEVTQPAGFGLRRPVILLPEGFFTLNQEAQRTVLCHELLHVARRDWPWMVVEEVARALFWFHPAVWWLVERIQESREQLVDRLVIARIPSTRAYMTALLLFDDSGDAMTPATAFLRKRHLRSRLRKLVKEPVMSRTRLVWTAVVLVCVLGSATAGTVVAFPLRAPFGDAAAAPTQEPVDSKDPGVTLPSVVSEVKPQYTPEAMRARIEGTVIMMTVVRTDGTPSDIEVTKSLDAEYGLDKQAVDALGQWRFKAGTKDGKPVPVRVTVEMRFTLKK